MLEFSVVCTCLDLFKLMSLILSYLVTFRCCNTCEDVREAYRRKGWALSSIDDVKQVTVTVEEI